MDTDPQLNMNWIGGQTKKRLNLGSIFLWQDQMTHAITINFVRILIFTIRMGVSTFTISGYPKSYKCYP